MPATLTPFTQYADDVMTLRYSHVVQGRRETFEEIVKRYVYTIMVGDHMPITLPKDVVEAVYEIALARKLSGGGRILSQAGRSYHQTDNCFCLRATDTREGWADLAHKTTMMFMSGGGVGVDYSDVRPYGTPLSRSGGIASGPVPLIEMINSIGAAARQGGERRGAIYASLKWDHPDIQQFIEMKTDGQSLKHTNISVRFDDSFPYTSNTAYSTFMSTLKHACQYGDPGFQFDWDDQILRNACTEIISRDDGESCCLGSNNLANIESLQELKEVTELGTLFLLCNTLYTDTPTAQVAEVKGRNRRLGLGLMGVAEWFIQRELPYGSRQYGNNADCIDQWLQTYQDESNLAAVRWASCLSVATPVAVRAIAPTGTISTAIGRTTAGIEPVFHTAYQRTYNTLKTQHNSQGYVTEKVIDPIVMKWVELGYDVRDIDTAWTLSQTVEGIERRLGFQAFVQQYVDNAISSTVNLPAYREGIEEMIGPVLLKYLPQLRGVTFYPDGRYENQPVVPLDIAEVLSESKLTLEAYESCKLGDSCGS